MAGFLAKIGTKLVDSLGGGIAKEAFDTLKDYFPPDMSEKEKAEAKMALQEMEHRRKMDAMEMAHQADQEFNQRTKDLEGTAADLKSVPIIGHIILLLRGAQRPAWGFLTLYMDINVFAKNWVVEDGSTQAVMLLCINILVLAFLFGERAMQNVLPILMPLLARFFPAGAAPKELDQ